jgi:hypothetical protein
MVKINRRVPRTVRVDEIPVGDTFIYEGKLCMRISLNSMFQTLNLENGRVMTGIHNDIKVQPVDCELNVLN